MRRFYPNIDPAGSVSEVYGYLTKKRPHRWSFMGLSAAVTGFIVWGLAHDSHAERPYKREIIYVENWTLNRTDAEIIAQQKIDQAEKDKRDAAIAAKKEKVRKEYQAIDDSLKKWGL